MADFDPEFEAWVQRARDVKIEEVASMAGARLRKAGAEMVGPCPRCQGKDRFSINLKEQVFNCRGAGGGDGIALVMHTQGVEFVEACEFINGDPPPRADKSAPPRPVDDRIERERAEERENDQRAKDEADAKAKAKKAMTAASIFEGAKPIAGTLADAYLRGRKLAYSYEAVADLRFAPALEYRGYADPDARDETPLGVFPCMVAAMRNAAGEIVGIHRTYLDSRKPEKLKTPGDSGRNLAKKMFGQKGLIRLGPARPIMAIGEGIETTLAWGTLAPIAEDFCLAAAGDLGNMAGGWTGTIEHPSNPRRSIPNAIPDPDRPGMAVPEDARELILLGDGDSDPANTRAHILTALRRHVAAGRIVSVHMAPKGKDWNDVLTARGEA